MGFRHIFFSTIILFFLVKNKNWIVVGYLKWMFDKKVYEFLSRIESRNYADCAKVKWALWKDCKRYCKTKGGGKGKPIYKYYGEKFDEYFAKLDMESRVITQDKGCKWEWTVILRLEQTCNQDLLKNFSKFKEIHSLKPLLLLWNKSCHGFKLWISLNLEKFG